MADPYDELRKSEREGVRPGFLGGEGGGEKPEGLERAARDDLRSAERAAGETGVEGSSVSETTSNEELDEVRSNEERPKGGFYSGSGRVKDEKGERKKGGKKPFLRFRKVGPSFGIFGILLAIGGLMGGAQSLMPIAIQEMIIEKFNSVGVSSTIASDAWLDTQLNQGVQLSNSTTGTKENLFAFSEHQVSEFEKQGIIVVDNVGSDTTSITALLYRKGDTYIPVVGSEMIRYSGLVNAIKIASGLGNIGEPVTASEALADPDFKTPYTTASKSWRGGSSGWFDNIMSNITETKLGVQRNRWARFVANAATDMSAEFKEIAKSPNLSKAGDDGIDAKYTKEETTTNSNGEEVTTYTEKEIVEVELVEGDQTKAYENVSDDTIRGMDSGDVGGTTEKVKDALSSKAIKAASAIGGYGCALLEGLVSIYTTLSAYQSLQFLNLVSGYLEAVSKVKAGDSGSSPVYEYNRELTTPGDTLDDKGEVVARNKTAMESQGMAWLFDKNSVIDQKDASVRNVNFETIMSNMSVLTSNIALTAEIYEQCGYVKATVAAVDLVTTIVNFVPVAGQAVKGIQLGAKAIFRAAVNISVQAALYFIIPIAVKNLTKMIISDAATEWFGEDLGNALLSGASRYLGGNGTSGGQSPGSEEKVAQYMTERDTVIAEEAEYQRQIRSPFDISSQYTFLGSLAYAAIPLAYSGNSVMSSIRNVSSILTSSVTKSLPTASAIDQVSAMNSRGDCDLLGSTGAMGDAFCNPYIITDVSTINYSPVAINDIVHRIGGNDSVAADSLYNNVISRNFDSDGRIKSDSNLAKYINYCGQRVSQYGIKDMAIYEKIVNPNTKVKKIINFTPILGSGNDFIEGIKEGANMSWMNGSACVASSENPYWDEEYKFYQRYAENERLLENMNPNYKSTVTAFLEEQNLENPIDNSLEGRLARFSGMTKEEVSDTLALIEYYNFVANYDASERYAFVATRVEEGKEVKFDNEYELSSVPVLLGQIEYADVRNRNYVV